MFLLNVMLHECLVYQAPKRHCIVGNVSGLAYGVLYLLILALSSELLRTVSYCSFQGRKECCLRKNITVVLKYKQQGTACDSTILSPYFLKLSACCFQICKNSFYTFPLTLVDWLCRNKVLKLKKKNRADRADTAKKPCPPKIMYESVFPLQLYEECPIPHNLAKDTIIDLFLLTDRRRSHPCFNVNAILFCLLSLVGDNMSV